MTAPAVLGWLVEALVASSLLMTAVLLVRVPVRRSFGAQIAYALWALPALRLLLPPLPADVAGPASMPISAAGEAMEVLILPVDGAAVVAQAPGLPWGTMALVTWALGTLAFLVIQVGRHRRFCARLLHEACVLDEIDGIRVIESAATIGPVAFGLHPRFVAFPRDFAERYDADERAFALLHELGHHRARDLLSNWAALGVLALHWFNPLAWHAFRAFRCDQELANDARVLAGRSRSDAHIYACAILKAAHGGHVPARAVGACHLHTIADLKGRMRMLTRNRPSRRRLAAGTTAVTALVVTGLGLTASGTRAASVVSTGIGDAVGIDLAGQSTPAAPPAPTAPAAAPAAPATPTAPTAPSAPTAGAAPRKIQRVVVVKDGAARTYEGAEAAAFAAENGLPTPPLPPAVPATIKGAPGVPDRQVSVIFRGEGTNPLRLAVPGGQTMCPDAAGGNKGPFTLKREDGDKNVVIVCRTEIKLPKGVAIGDRGLMTGPVRLRTIEGDARANALIGLMSARASIVGDRNLSDEQRRNALAGLDQARRELQSSRN